MQEIKAVFLNKKDIGMNSVHLSIQNNDVVILVDENGCTKILKNRFGDDIESLYIKKYDELNFNAQLEITDLKQTIQNLTKKLSEISEIVNNN